MNILVTGAAGFLGRRLRDELRRAGHRVTCHDVRKPEAETDSASETWVTGDVSRGEGLDRVAWDNVSAVVHLAAAGVKAATRQWAVCVDVNILGTEHLLSRLSRCAVPPVLVYTRTFYEDFLDRVPTLRDNAYVFTKSRAARLVERYARESGRPAVIGTVYQAYGPGDAAGNVLTYAARCLKSGETALLSSGRPERDWIHVEDVASALAASLAATVSGGLVRYDFGCGRLVSIRDAVLRLCARAGVSPDRVVFDPARDRDDSVISSYARQPPPGWRPRVSLDEGLQTLLDEN